MCPRLQTPTLALVVGLASLTATLTAYAQEIWVAPATKPPTGKAMTESHRPDGGPRLDLFDDGNRFQVAPLDVPALLAEDAGRSGPLRIGVEQACGVDSSMHGRWTALADGGRLWTMSFATPTAVGLRLGLNARNLPRGSELLIYDTKDPGEMYGPFSTVHVPSDATFWTPTVFADEVSVEYYVPPGIDALGAGSPVRVDRVGQIYRGFYSRNDPADALGCHEDVTCYPGWTLQSDGVGVIAFHVADKYIWICSGSMLNRTPSDFTSLFSTATHCGINNGNVDSVEVFWFFQSSVCDDDTTVPDVETCPRSIGRTVLVRDTPTDWTLVLLSDDAPGGLTYEGWTSGYWPITSAAVGIHHPRCNYKRISFGTKGLNLGTRPDPSNPPNCMAGNAYIIDWDDGLIEKGSSGSPIFDDEGLVRGVLSCGDGDCTDFGLGTYGRLDQSIDLLRPWLEPTDPIFVDSTASGDEDGTAGNPFNTVAEGTAAVHRGSDIFIEGGSYNERFVIDKPMTLNAILGAVTIGE